MAILPAWHLHSNLYSTSSLKVAWRQRLHLCRLKHVEHMREVLLEFVPDGKRNVAKARKDLWLDGPLYVLRLQVGQQDLHDTIAVGVDLIFHSSAHVSQYPD